MKRNYIPIFKRLIYLKHFPKLRSPYFENIEKYKYSLCTPLPRDHIHSRIFSSNKVEEDEYCNYIKFFQINTVKESQKTFKEDSHNSMNHSKQIYTISNLDMVSQGKQKTKMDITDQKEFNIQVDQANKIERNKLNGMQSKDIDKENNNKINQNQNKINKDILKKLSKVNLNSIRIFLN